MEVDVLAAVVLTALTAAFLALGIGQTLRAPVEKVKFQEALDDMMAGELRDLSRQTMQPTAPDKRGWFGYWKRTAAQAGQLFDNDRTPGWVALRIAGLAALAGMLVWPGGAVGLLAVPLVVVVAWAGWLRMQAGKRMATMEKQLPVLLAGLRSYLQVPLPPAEAIMNVADDVPSPLGDELQLVKNNVSIAMPLDQALQLMSDRVKSREMQFLVSSVEIAVTSGADLEPQLKTIEDVVEARTRARQKLATAVAGVRPTQIVASLAVPLFLINSFREPTSVAFWLSSMGIAVLAGVAVLTFVALWGMRVMIKRIENL